MLKQQLHTFLKLAAALVPEICQRCDRLLSFRERVVCDRCLGELLDAACHADWSGTHRSIAPFPILAAAGYSLDIAPILFGPKRAERPLAAKGFIDALVPRLPLSPPFDRTSVLLAVPSHRKHVWRRGYHPAGLVAQALSQTYGFPRARLQLRKKSRVEQKAKSRSERRRLEPSNFQVVGSMIKQPLLLVDDVCGSGATLAACAAQVTAAGGQVVGAVVMFARPEEQA